VGRLDLLVQTPAGLGTSTCTASIVSSRYILTNNHCFPDGVRAASLLMDFYREDDDGGGNRFEARVQPVERNATLDYAVVEVMGDPASRFGTVRLDARDPSPGESLLVIHHPAGLPKHMTRGGCRAIQPVAVSGTDIRHRCDTLGGSSGSPILADASGRMLGLHYAGTTNAATTGFNFGKRLTEIVKDSRILAGIAEAQAREDRRPAAVDAAARAEIERQARERAEAAAKAEVDRLKAQLDAERARVAALPPAAAPAARPDPAADLAAAEAALGLTAEQLRAIQSWLEALGHDPRGVDGRIGAGTRAALRSYQKARGLAETGHLDADLARRLAQEGPEAVGRRDAARGAMAAAVRPPAPATPASPAQPAVGIWPQPPREPPRSFRDCPECPEMVVVPAGTTWLASGRNVAIAAPFAVGKFEVTFEEWDACVAATSFFSINGCRHRPDDQGWGRRRQPVINVSWDDVQAYVAWLSQKTGKQYRLLSEAEWEYAAQAGSDREAAVTPGANQANCITCGSRWDGRQTAPVGSFAANAFGLHDMLGNVWEWTADCWNENHAGAPADGSPRTIGQCSSRVLRGGAWILGSGNSRSAYRARDPTGDRYRFFGFRVARTL
jgi:formylglycine-generating enzyme required for sulfatase activity